MRQDQYELKGAVLEVPLEWQGLRLAPGRGGVLVTGLEGTDQRRFQRQLTVLKGYAALAAGQAGGTPPPPAAGGPAGAGRAGDPGRSLVRPGGGGGGPTRHPGGLLQRVRRPAGGFAAMEESLARWAGRPLGEKLLDYVQAVRREEGDLAEKAEPFQTLPSWTDRETGELLRALLRALCEGSGGRGSAQG